MKIKRTTVSRSPWLAGAAIGLTAWAHTDNVLARAMAEVSGLSPVRRVPFSSLQFHFGYEGVLGTSMDLTLQCARSSDAEAAEQCALQEIERLCRILSTYDPNSEIRQAMLGGPVRSPELEELLSLYEIWNKRSEGVIDINLSEVIALWKRAAAHGEVPDRAALAMGLRAYRAWNIDALGKGFVIDRVVNLTRQIAPAGLLNIGGDIRVWGENDWLIGVADPREPADNGPILALAPVREAAVATSGGYARQFRLADKALSHLIDPRDQSPVERLQSATFIAPDATTANALSAYAAIAGLDRAIPVAATAESSGGLAVDAAGVVRSNGLLTGTNISAAASQNSAWPTNFQVTVSIQFKTQGSSRGPDPFSGGANQPPGRGGRGGPGAGKRPYMALWVEDLSGNVVRNVALWASETKYYPELSQWWGKIGGNMRMAQSISRATRAPGAYTLAWNGMTDAGRALPAGNYKICLEINREHGSHVSQSVVLHCGPDPVMADLKATSESDAGQVQYGPKPL